MFAVTVKPRNYIYFLFDRPDEGPWEVEEGVDIDIPPDLNEWPPGTKRPMEVLCRSTSDPKSFKVFKYQEDIDPSEFTPTGKNFTVLQSKGDWERLVQSWPLFAVTLKPLNTIFFLAERPDGDQWKVEGGVEIDIPSNYLPCRRGTERPESLLCQSITNPKRYKVFLDSRDIDPARFSPTGKNFGGVFSKETWEGFAPRLLEELSKPEVPDDDPPGAMDEALRRLRRKH